MTYLNLFHTFRRRERESYTGSSTSWCYQNRNAFMYHSLQQWLLIWLAFSLTMLSKS